jgi:hypothetical protein
MSFNPDRKLKVCKVCLAFTDDPTVEHAYPRWLRRKLNAYFDKPPRGVEPFKGWEQTSKTGLEPVCRDCQRQLNHGFKIRRATSSKRCSTT